MALIGKIRKNSWLLIILIGLGLGGFIIMDMTSGQQSVFGSSQTVVGSVEGQKLDWNQFMRTESILYGNSGADVFARRNSLWNYYIEEALINKEADALGLGVSKTELLDLQFGPNPSAIIRSRFQDPATGQVDRARLNEFRTAIENGTLTDPQIISFWAHQEKEVIKERLQSKLSNMVSKGLYTPTWMAEMGHQEQNGQVSFAFVKVPFDELDNTDVALSDEDYSSFIKENAARFETKEETRRLDYVVFDVHSTPEDSAKWEKQIADLIPEFEQTEDDSLFVERNYGSIDAAYFTASSLSPAISDTVFEIPVGSVYGPYIENNAYNAVKVIDRKVIPDSVRSRHILIRADLTNPLSAMQAQNRVDSLKGLLEAGTHSFDSLALAFGTDGTSTLGGDLGYAGPGAMVKPFNDLIFFEAEEGELYSVITQFGVHLVEVTGRKFINNEEGVKVAYISQSIVPSEETQSALYDDVLEFVGQNRSLEQLREAVGNRAELSIESTPPLKNNDFTFNPLGSGQSTRDMIRWAFQEAELNDVSPEIYIYQDAVELFNNKYVLAALKSISKPGLPSVDDVREQIEQEVINKKKGDQLKEQMAGKDLSTLASTYDVPVDTASNVNFSSGFIANVGNEPAVIATALSLNEAQSAAPIVGNSGVFVLQVISKNVPGAATNIPQIRRTMAGNIRSQVSFRLIETLKENAEITDRRSRFY